MLGEPSTPEAPSPAPPLVVRGLSWDIVAGGIPEHGDFFEVGLGFSALPRIAYHHALERGLSAGGSATFDYAALAPSDAFFPRILVGSPVRYALHHGRTFSVAVRAEPGLSITLRAPFTFGVFAELGASFALTVQDRLLLGGGVDLPLSLQVPATGGTPFFTLPVLFGPIAELHVTPPLALFADFKLGPHISTGSIGTRFGLKLIVGVGFRL